LEDLLIRFLVVIPVLLTLALGGCAISPDRVPATFVSAKQHLFSGCRELAEDMAQQNFTVYNSKSFKEIATAKGELNALSRAGYEKRCGEQERPAQPAQVIVVPQAAVGQTYNYYQVPQPPQYDPPQQYAPASYAPPQPQYVQEYAPAYAPAYLQMGRPAYPQPGRPAFFRGGYRAGGGGGSYSGGH
jgi:hypothetical protein